MNNFENAEAKALWLAGPRRPEVRTDSNGFALWDEPMLVWVAHISEEPPF